MHTLPFYRKSTQMFVLLVFFGVLALYASAEDKYACTNTQISEMPCRCCKMQCWGTISRSATHELGHIPGQAGEEEAMATLKLIRACMIQECAGVCMKKVAFRPRALAALLEARKQAQEI